MWSCGGLFLCWTQIQLHRGAMLYIICQQKLDIRTNTWLELQYLKWEIYFHGRQVKLFNEGCVFWAGGRRWSSIFKNTPLFLQHGQVKGIYRTVLLFFNSILFLLPISLFFWKKQDNWYVKKTFFSQKVAHCYLSQYIARSSAGI